MVERILIRYIVGYSMTIQKLRWFAPILYSIVLWFYTLSFKSTIKRLFKRNNLYWAALWTFELSKNNTKTHSLYLNKPIGSKLKYNMIRFVGPSYKVTKDDMYFIDIGIFRNRLMRYKVCPYDDDRVSWSVYELKPNRYIDSGNYRLPQLESEITNELVEICVQLFLEQANEIYTK